MKANLFSALLVLLCLWTIQPKLFSQTIANDSIAVYWEHLDGAPGYVSHFAQSGNKLFAATPDGLFQSTDGGHNWRENKSLGRCYILTIFANDSVVLVVEQRKFLVGTYYTRYVKELLVHRSNNKGLTWNQVATIPINDYEGGDPSFHVSSIQEIGVGKYSLLLNQNNETPEHWYAQDYGQTWNHIAYTAYNLMSLNANDGKYSGICRSASGNIITGYLSSNPNLSDLYTIPFPPLNAPIVAAISRAGAFRIFLRNNTVVSSLDAGSSWQTQNLPVGDSILAVEAKEADLYIKTNRGIWHGQFFLPTSLTQIYAGEEGLLPTANTFAALPSGYWVNTESNQSIYKPYGNTEWQIRSQGLSTAVLSLEGVCGRLFCHTGIQYIAGAEFPADFYRSNQEDGSWEALTVASQEYAYNLMNYNYLGKANGFDFSYAAPYIARSSDCGVTWDTLANQLVGAAIRGMSSSGNRLFFFSPHDSNAFFTDDNGDSWLTLTIPNFATAQNIFANGDTIMAFETGGSVMHRTVDFGQNWETLTLSSLPNTNKSTFWQKGHKIISLRQKYQSNSSNYIVSIHVSNDNGTTWQQSFSTAQNYVGPDPPYSKSIASFPLVQDGLIFMHAQYGLQVTSDEGLHWTRIAKIPFSNRLPLENDSPFKDTLAEGAQIYLVNDGYLYAATEAQGIWRTPFSLIRDQALVNGGEYGFLKGRIYRDLNYTCNYEQPAGDLPLGQKTVSVQPGNILVNTDNDGYFDLALSPGVYQVSTVIPPYHYTNCGIPYPLTAVVTAGNRTNTELPLLPTPGIRDVCLLFTTPVQARPGFPVVYKLQVSNVGNETINDAVATLTFDAQWLEAQSIAPLGQFVGNQAVIPIDSLLPGQVVILTLHLVASPTTPIGTILNFVADCPLLDDAKPSNNSARGMQTVTGSFDPNDKMAQPLQVEPPGQARLLDYLIRFQNTGTDTAFTVVVTDTLDPRLDPMTLRTVEASHQFDFSWKSNGLAQWTFRNILLPDSTTNEPESHGYVRFQIEIPPGVLPGNAVLNDADIFFDFNSPVRTNEFISENPKWTVTNTFEVKLCAGEVWNGSAWEQSATIQDTLGNAWSDTILLTHILVSPTWVIQMDTAITQSALIFGVPVMHDTTFIFHYQTSLEACDSTVIWNVMVLSSGTSELPGQGFQFKISPNPTMDEAWLTAINYEVGEEIALKICMTDATGHLLRQWTELPSFLKDGLKLEIEELPGGVYFIEMRLSNAKTVQKLIKI